MSAEDIEISRELVERELKRARFRNAQRVVLNERQRSGMDVIEFLLSSDWHNRIYRLRGCGPAAIAEFRKIRLRSRVGRCSRIHLKGKEAAPEAIPEARITATAALLIRERSIQMDDLGETLQMASHEVPQSRIAKHHADIEHLVIAALKAGIELARGAR